MLIVLLSNQHDDILAVEQVVNEARVEPPDVVGNDDKNCTGRGHIFGARYSNASDDAQDRSQ